MDTAPLLTTAEIETLNAARSVLASLKEKAGSYQRLDGLNEYDAHYTYIRRGRLAEAADLAEDGIFNVLNTASSSSLVRLTKAQLHND